MKTNILESASVLLQWCFGDKYEIINIYIKIFRHAWSIYSAYIYIYSMVLHIYIGSTMECSQPAAWATNRSLHVASHAKAIPWRPTNSCSTIPRAAHLDGSVIGCRQCITTKSGSAPAALDMRPTTLALSRMYTIHHLYPYFHPTHDSHD